MAVFWLSRTEIQSPSGTFTGVAYITSVIIYIYFLNASRTFWLLQKLIKNKSHF